MTTTIETINARHESAGRQFCGACEAGIYHVHEENVAY